MHDYKLRPKCNEPTITDPEMERVILIFVFLFGSCVGGMPCPHPSADACLKHSTIDEPHRSIHFTATNTDRLLCDTNLVEGWYRLMSNGKDVDMPTFCVDTDNCGTFAPIWLQGTLPSIKGEAVTLKACVNRGQNDDVLLMLLGGTKCCHNSWDICVKNCGAHNVYWLTRAPGCSIAYCAGSQHVTPALYPHMTSQPKLTHHCNYEKATFRCEIPYDPNDASAIFEVTWLVDGLPLKNPLTGNVEKSQISSGTRIVDLDVLTLFKNIDKDLQCQVTSFYQNSKTTHSQTLKSNNLFVGIKSYPHVVNVSESEKEVNVTLSTSIPLCTVGTPDCNFGVEILHNKTADATTSQCSYQFEYNASTKKCEAIVPVKAKRDFLDDGNQLHEIAFRPIQPGNSVRDNQTTMWLYHNISSIHVTTIDKKPGFCNFWMDPHVVTISGSKYDILDSRYVLMYRKKPNCKKHVRNLEVHLRTLIGCTHGVACTCAMVAVEGNDYVEIDTCTQTKGVHHVTRKTSTPDGTTFHMDVTGRIFYINFPSGAHIEAKVYYRVDFFEYVQLHIPSDHKGCEEGACGSFDKNQQVDINKSNLMQCEKTLFHDPNKPTNNGSIAHPSTTFCSCDKKTNTTSCHKSDNPNRKVFAGGKGLPVTQNSNSNMCGNPHPRSVSTQSSGNQWIPIHSRSALVTGAKRSSGLTVSNATNLCKSAFRRASLFKYCGEALESYPALLSGCIFDLQASDNLKFLSGYTSTYMGVCQIVLSADPKNSVIGPDGYRTLKTDLTSNICLNDCSEQGTCSNSICTCQNGYQGPDCSIKIGAIPHIHFIYGSYDVTNMCDARNGSCSSAFVVADNLFYTQTLQCKIESLKFANGHLVPHTNTAPVIVGGLFSSSNEVECPLPSSTVREVTHGVMVAGFNISVTTDGHTFSNAQTFTLYDSLCQECTETGTCHIKSGVCAIDGFCRRKGEQNSQQQVCEPSVDQLHWTTDARIKEIDHYTASATGCLCPDDPGSFTCACCQNGGCPCGYRSPHQCVKCGQWNLCG